MNTSTEFQRVPQGYSLQEYQQISKRYLKAVCRLYLIDFKCFHYSLPADCEELNGEFKAHVDEMHYAKHRKSIFDHFMNFMRATIPHNVLDVISEIACFFDSAPECKYGILYGTVGDFPERHDEL